MITPTFKVDQDNDSVTIVINTPYVRVCHLSLYIKKTNQKTNIAIGSRC